MAMGFSLDARLEQNLSLQLTPSQKLSLEILQLNIQDLEQRIENELESNPLLEVAEETHSKDSLPDDKKSPTEDRAEDSFVENQHMQDMSEYFEPYINESYSGQKVEHDADDDDDFLGNIASHDKSLEEYISEQIEYLNPPAHLKPYIMLIIAHLDERGYLSAKLEDMKLDGQENKSDYFEEAYQYITGKLDPPGLGARDLQHCLVLQTERFGADFDFEKHILENHFEDLLHNRLDAIAKANHCDIEKIVEVVEYFKTLDFRPAEPFTESSSEALRPDAIIKYDAPDSFDDKGRFIIQLCKKGIPEIRVIPGEVYKKGKMSKEEKQFIIDRTASGKALIEAIRRRNETLFLAIQVICNFQIDFFEEGPGGLKPLLMQEVAKQMGMSAATITRTVKDKTVQTDFGLFPLKYFFSLKKVKMGDGEINDREEIIDSVKKVIDSEDKSKPLSDAAISKKLAEQGHRIATRTISKYRDILNIPSSHKRKRF